MLLHSASTDMVSAMPDGVIIQPSRQPVIAQALEKPLSTKTGSVGSARVRKEGAGSDPSKTLRW